MKMARGSEGFYNECDPCKSQGVTSAGSAYCTVCTEYMCRTCEKAHRGSKFSRDHKILTGSEMQGMDTKTNPPIMYCEHHKTMTSDLYCVNHDVVVCEACKLTDHTKCDTTEVSQQTERVKGSDIIGDTMKQLIDLKKKYELLKDSRQADRKHVKVELQKCKQNMQKLRQQINDTFDQLEQTFLKESSGMEENMTKEIDNHVTIVDDALTQINDRIKDLEECKKTIDDDSMFVGAKKTRSLKHKYEQTLSRIDEQIYPIEIDFKPNDVITDILLQLQSLGTLQIKEKSGHVKPHTTLQTDTRPVNRTSTESLQTKRGLSSTIKNDVSLWNMTVDDKQEIDVGSQRVWDCSFIGDSHLVLACGNDGLKLLDNKYKVQSQLPDHSVRIATINETEIIITQYDMKQLKHVRVLPTMVITKTIKTDRLCAGVDVYNDEIYITCHNDPGNGVVLILNMDGVIKRRIGVRGGKYMFSSPHCVKVRQDGSKIFVSDLDTHLVTCLSQTGDVLFQYKDGKLKTPAGMYLSGGDTLLVCGGISNNVHIAKQDGSGHRVVLTKKDGVKDPFSVAYSDGRLVVGLYKADKALIVCKIGLV